LICLLSSSWWFTFSHLVPVLKWSDNGWRFSWISNLVSFPGVLSYFQFFSNVNGLDMDFFSFIWTC
jgi:hypothetical protein